MNLHKNIIKGWLPENGRKCRNLKKRNHHIQWRRLKIRFCYIPVGYSSIFILVCIIKHPLNILLIHLQSINQLNSLRDSSLIRKDKFYHFELTRIKVFLSILFAYFHPEFILSVSFYPWFPATRNLLLCQIIKPTIFEAWKTWFNLESSYLRVTGRLYSRILCG